MYRKWKMLAWSPQYDVFIKPLTSKLGYLYGRWGIRGAQGNSVFQTQPGLWTWNLTEIVTACGTLHNLNQTKSQYGEVGTPLTKQIFVNDWGTKLSFLWWSDTGYISNTVGQASCPWVVVQHKRNIISFVYYFISVWFGMSCVFRSFFALDFWF